MVVLPVHLLYMEAVCDDGTPSIIWSTATELNNALFLIERAVDGISWDTVGQVAGAGNSQQVITYTWHDESEHLEGVLYYRLRQVDLDGHDELLPTLPLQACKQEGTTLLLYPNPAEDRLNLQLIAHKERDRPMIIAVHDLQGRVVLRRNASTTDGQLYTVLGVNGLAQGSYELRMQGTDGGPMGSARFVKR